MLAKAFFGVFFLFVSFVFVFASTNTTLNIPNTPPVFNGIIPNFSWTGGAYEDAFNLNDYFVDYQGDVINYSVIGMGNITVFIDLDGNVSFYPPVNYIGLEKVVFRADDGSSWTDSNDVYLGVGVDIEAPKWSNPRKDLNRVYQNSDVLFSVDWTDNFGLKIFTFFIDNGFGWENKTGLFSGVVNTSSVLIKISAPEGKIVKWYFCASDLSDNSACSDEFEFEVLISPTIPDSNGGDYSDSDTYSNETGADGSLDSGDYVDMYKESEKLIGDENLENFSVSVDSLQVLLKQGDRVTKTFEVSNIGKNELDFKIDTFGLDNFIEISVSNFSLKPGESRVISVDFSSSLRDRVDQYFGRIVIDSSEEFVLPVVLEIEPTDLVFDVDVLIEDGFEFIKPGEDVEFFINVSNLKDVVTSDVVLYYAIKDFYGGIIDSSEEKIKLGSYYESKKSLNVPRGVLLGKYLVYVRVYNEKDVAISSDDFVVGLRFRLEAFLKTSVVFLSILVLVIICVVLYFRYRMKKANERALNLYVKLAELKDLIKEGKYDKAASVFISLKRIYGEHISEDILKDKDALVDKIREISSGIVFEEEEEKSEDSEEEKGEGDEDLKEKGEEKEGGEKEKSSEKKGEVEKNGEERGEEKSDKKNTKKEEGGAEKKKKISKKSLAEEEKSDKKNAKKEEGLEGEKEKEVGKKTLAMGKKKEKEKEEFSAKGGGLGGEISKSKLLKLRKIIKEREKNDKK